jgi:uncharacterized Rmd1/YagE family protein
VSVEKGTVRHKLRSKDSEYRSNIMRLSAINTSSLFNIRSCVVGEESSHKAPYLMDNYKSFLQFFEISVQHEHKQTEDDYEKLLNGFKTLFPRYILYNEQIKHAIAEATGQYLQSYDQMQSSASHMYCDNASVEDFFNFKEDDTMAIISTIKYS